ncbi:hypothetical protein PCE1_002503 [Barthelona sp. PCE]
MSFLGFGSLGGSSSFIEPFNMTSSDAFELTTPEEMATSPEEVLSPPSPTSGESLMFNFDAPIKSEYETSPEHRSLAVPMPHPMNVQYSMMPNVVVGANGIPQQLQLPPQHLQMNNIQMRKRDATTFDNSMAGKASSNAHLSELQFEIQEIERKISSKRYSGERLSDLKKQRRRLKNRESAHASRARKKKKLQALECEVDELRDRNSKLENTIAMLQQQLLQQQQQQQMQQPVQLSADNDRFLPKVMGAFSSVPQSLTFPYNGMDTRRGESTRVFGVVFLFFFLSLAISSTPFYTSRSDNSVGMHSIFSHFSNGFAFKRDLVDNTAFVRQISTIESNWQLLGIPEKREEEMFILTHTEMDTRNNIPSMEIDDDIDIDDDDYIDVSKPDLRERIVQPAAP